VSGAPPPAPIRVIGRAITWLVARFPATWRLLRAPTRRFFDRLAPVWDERTARPDRMAAMEEALGRVEAAPARILDLGTGTGVAALWLAERFPAATVTGVDVAPEMIARAREKVPPQLGCRVRFEIADASALPYDDDSFDLVVQISAPAFFAETARVLASGGHLVVVSSHGAATPFHTSVELLRRGFEREGLEWMDDGAAGGGTWYLLHKPG
jgi:SAM-dependent methyltransferase